MLAAIGRRDNDVEARYVPNGRQCDEAAKRKLRNNVMHPGNSY